MQTVSEVMSRNARVVAPHETLQRAAQLMDELDVGALPVCDGERLVGMVTDRDLTVRGFAAGKMPQEAHVDEVMTGEVRWCYEDQPLDEVMVQMADSQVRRIPVISHDEQRRLVGIVSLGDVAIRSGPEASPDVQDLAEVLSRPGVSSGPSVPVERIVGQRGEVSGPAAAGSPLQGPAGTDLPGAGGESGIGAAGGSGQPRDDGAGQPVRTGNTTPPRDDGGAAGPGGPA
jgi:CBS domain-containing protein